ncbi:MAG: hypothetical protein OIF34_08655, partial [Porticoccaceae bacterium]|nr:hypothetical protein [Porticoccaceae bacterium]
KQGPLREERRTRRGRPRPAVVIPAPASPDEALSMLKVRHDRTAELLRWFSPDRLRDYQQSYVHDHFQWLCSDHGLNAYRHMVPGHQLPLSRFKRELNSIARRGEMVKVRQRGVIHGSYYPW